MANQVATTGSREVASRYDGSEATRARALFSPRTDIYETNDGIVLVAEMPGVSPEDVDITLERGVLTIRGRMPDATHEGYREIYAEYGEGNYERVFTLSEDIDRESIKAKQKDGVLTVEPSSCPRHRPHGRGRSRSRVPEWRRSDADQGSHSLEPQGERRCADGPR
jgi:HSP20 family protein